jgi:hypothetical protein
VLEGWAEDGRLNILTLLKINKTINLSLVNLVLIHDLRMSSVVLIHVKESGYLSHRVVLVKLYIYELNFQHINGQQPYVFRFL